MIEIITTATSVEQAKQLLKIGVDTLYIGEENYGLRLPTSFSLTEIEEITQIAHQKDKKVCVAVNAIMHNEKIEKVPSYLQFLKRIKVDSITVGDPGIIHLLKKHKIELPYVYDGQTLVTSARQINFWEKRGAVGAVLARELTYEELKAIRRQIVIPPEILVYGPTCIHHSKRPLIKNYFNYTEKKMGITKGNTTYISETKKPETHYSIYEDDHGTHVFATNDINLLPVLNKLFDANIYQWKLDGLFIPEDTFLTITEMFIKAKQALLENHWSENLMEKLNRQLLAKHPADRGLDTGFFLKDPNEVK